MDTFSCPFLAMSFCFPTSSRCFLASASASVYTDSTDLRDRPLRRGAAALRVDILGSQLSSIMRMRRCNLCEKHEGNPATALSSVRVSPVPETASRIRNLILNWYCFDIIVSSYFLFLHLTTPELSTMRQTNSALCSAPLSTWVPYIALVAKERVDRCERTGL